MLVEFSITNFRSIHNTQTLSMVADTNKKSPELNSFQYAPHNNLRLLRSAIIYGPNASGKSNFIKAMSFMRQFIITDSSKVRENLFQSLNPFMFTEFPESNPTAFEVIFVVNNVRYQYGFSLLMKKVHSEWLYAYPKNRAQKWFTRDQKNNMEDIDWSFGLNLAGHKNIWKDSTRADSLYLTTAVSLNSEQLQPLFEWFNFMSVIEHGKKFAPSFTISNCQKSAEKTAAVLSLIKAADHTIQKINIKKVPITELNFPDEIPDSLRKKILSDFEGKQTVKVEFLHAPDLDDLDESKSNDTISSLIPLEDESDGTRKLFAYIALWMDVLLGGKVIFIDELESSFHVKLLFLLIKLIHDNEINTGNGQLIFTSHNTALLQKDIFRRDQIWFVEKQGNLSSKLYPLTDFHPRSEDALQERYLQGRYGAIPFTDDFEVKVVEYDAPTEE